MVGAPKMKRPAAAAFGPDCKDGAGTAGPPKMLKLDGPPPKLLVIDGGSEGAVVSVFCEGPAFSDGVGAAKLNSPEAEVTDVKLLGALGTLSEAGVVQDMHF